MRDIDPSTAAFVPVDVEMKTERVELGPDFRDPPRIIYSDNSIVTMRVAAWHRSTNEILEWEATFVTGNENSLTMKRRNVSREDKEWLKNIGAFGKENE